MNNSSYIGYTQNISNNVNFYVDIIFLPICIIFNSLSIFVFTRSQFRNNKFSFLSCWLIVFQTISFIGFFLFSFPPTVGQNLLHKSNFSCKMMIFARRVSGQIASWAQTICTFETFLEVKYLNKFNLFKRKWLSLFLITILMLIFLSVINSTNLLYHLNYKDKNKTQIECIAPNFDTVSDIISILMRNFLPFFVMLILNILIAKNIIQSKKKFQTRRTKRREFHFIFTTISMNIIFTLFFTPLSITYIIRILYKYNSSSTAIQIATIQLVYNVNSALSFIYNALPFLINLLFNKLFKNQVIVIIEKSSLICKNLNQLRTKNDAILENINSKTRDTLSTFL